MKRISNLHIQNYLEENNVFPAYEDCGIAYYYPCRKLFQLLESYTIQYICVPNKL